MEQYVHSSWMSLILLISSRSLSREARGFAEAERLEREAGMRRERAVEHGAHPDLRHVGGTGAGTGGPCVAGQNLNISSFPTWDGFGQGETLRILHPSDGPKLPVIRTPPFTVDRFHSFRAATPFLRDNQISVASSLGPFPRSHCKEDSRLAPTYSMRDARLTV